MATLKRRFFFLKPGVIHTFKIKAYSAGTTSAWSEPIDLKTSEYLPLSWNMGALPTPNLYARARYWGRYIWLKWTPITAHRIGYVQRFDHYMIFRKEGITPTQAELDIADDSNPYYYADSARLTVYRDYEIEADKTYYYWIRAVDKKGMPSSNYLLDEAPYGKPNEPTITDCDTQLSATFPRVCDVKVKWTCVGAAEFYWVSRKLSGASVWSWPIRVENDASLGDDQEAVLQNFLVNTPYDFRVQAVNVVGILKSDWSETYSYTTGHDEVGPGPPSSFDADIPKNQNYVVLRWGLPDTWLRDEIKGYEIHRRRDARPNGSSYKIADVGNVLFYKDDTVTNISGYENHDYYYAVKTVDRYGGKSKFSDYDSVSFDAPNQVDISKSHVTSDQIFSFWSIVTNYAVTFAWVDVTSADWYEVEWQWKKKNFSGSYGGWTEWHGPITVNEDKVVSGYAHVTVPVQGNGIIKFRIKSYNARAGAKAAVETDETVVGADKTAPDKPTGGSIKAHGTVLAWLSNELSWNTHAWEYGVKAYRIEKSTWEDDGTNLGWQNYWQVLPNRFGKKTNFIDWYPARLNARIATIAYRIYAIDYADNESTTSLMLAAHRPK